MKRSIVKYTYCIFLFIALFALYLLYAFKVPITNATPRCSHTTNYFKGYGKPGKEKGVVKFGSGGGCGCGMYYLGTGNWAYFVHEKDKANTSTKSYENGFPKGSHKKDYVGGKLPTISADPGTCAPSGKHVSCYFREWGKKNGSRNYVLANKGLTQGGEESKYIGKDETADFCPGHGFECNSIPDEKETIDNFTADTDVFTRLKYKKVSLQMGAFKRTGNIYSMYDTLEDYDALTLWDDCCKFGDSKESAKSDENTNVVEKSHESFTMSEWEDKFDFEMHLVPNYKKVIINYIVEQNPTAAFYGHDLELKSKATKTTVNPERPCDWCYRKFPTTITVTPGDLIHGRAYALKQKIVTDNLDLPSAQKKYIDECIALHHWMRPELFHDGDISDFLEKSGGKSQPERSRAAFVPIMFGTQVPFNVHAVCAMDSAYLHDVDFSKATTSEQRKAIKRRSACEHVEKVTSTHMIVAFHTSNLLDPEPTKDGYFKDATTTDESAEELANPTQLLKSYRLDDNLCMEYPYVECTPGKVIESWQASPLPDDASSDLHEAYSPNAKNYKFYSGSEYSIQFMHSLLTGLLDADSGMIKTKKAKNLQNSKYALFYESPSSGKDKEDYVTKFPNSSLLYKSVMRMTAKYDSSGNMGDIGTVNERDLYNNIYPDLTYWEFIKDQMIAYMVSRNIDIKDVTKSKPLVTDNGTQLNKQKTVLYGAFSDVGDSTITTSLSTILARGLYYSMQDKQYKFDPSVAWFAYQNGYNIIPSYFASHINQHKDVKFTNSIGQVDNNNLAASNIESFPKINELTHSITMCYGMDKSEDDDTTDEDDEPATAVAKKIVFKSQYLPKFTAYDETTGNVMVEQFNVQRFSMDALTGQDMGAEAQSNPLTAVNLYGNIVPMRYVVNHQIDGLSLISPYVMPDDMEGAKTSTNKYKAAAKSTFKILDKTDNNYYTEQDYIQRINPNTPMYFGGSDAKARLIDWSYLEHDEDDVRSYGLLLYGWWYGNHVNADSGTNEGAYKLYGEPHLRDSQDREWYYTATDSWNVSQDNGNDTTYSPWLLKKSNLEFGATITNDLCSAVQENDYYLSSAPGDLGTNIYGIADLYTELKPKSYSIRYIVNDKYADPFDKSCPETGKDNYFEDKNYYGGKAHYFDATKDTPVNYHDRDQGTSANRGTKWETGGNYPKAYKQGCYLAGWQYYGDDFHEYGTDEGDDKNHPTGFIAAGDKIQAFQYYPKYKTTSKNVAYLYAVWKPYEYTITYKKGAGDSGSDISQKKPFGVFYEADDTGEECYDLFTNTVGTFASTPRRTYTYEGETYDLDIDINMKSAPHFKKFGHYISSWTGTIGTTNSTKKKVETGDFKKSKYYGSGWGADWTSDGLNKAYEKPKSGTKYSPDGGTTTQSNAHNTKAKAKYLRIDEDLVIPGDESYNHLPEDIEPRGHNLKITYTAKWSPILYNVVYKQDTDGTNGAVSVGGDIVTGNYQFGKTYSTHKNPKTNDGWSRSTPGGESVWKGWCFVDKDTGLHPHFTAGNATNVTEVSTSTEESSRGANFYTKSKTQGSWYRGMGQWGYPYTDDHNYGSSTVHGGNQIVEASGLTYTQYFDYLHDDVDPSTKGKIGSFPLYGVWDDKPGWEPQDLIWSFQKMETLINSNGGRYSTNAMNAVERVFREAEASIAGQGAQDREHNDAVVASNTYTDKANSMRLFEFEKTFEDICKQTFDNRYANTEGRAASTFSLNWYYASPDASVKPNQTDTTFYRRKLYLTDSATWRNLQIERKRANGQAVTQNANLPWCQNFYKTSSGRATTDYASDSLDDIIDKY